MNNDGWITAGTGPNDDRLAGKDLQHNVQTRTADEAPHRHRIVRQHREDGGPMKHQNLKDRLDESIGSSRNPMYELLEAESNRHADAQAHQRHHLERHHKRHHDSQHGHDHYKK
jgi:hypothetical protein